MGTLRATRRRRITAQRHLTSSPRRHLYGLRAYFMQLKLQMQRNLHFLHLLQQINVYTNAKIYVNVSVCLCAPNIAANCIEICMRARVCCACVRAKHIVALFNMTRCATAHTNTTKTTATYQTVAQSVKQKNASNQ